VSQPHVWRAEHGDVTEVTRLLVAFRDWSGSTSPSAASFLASVQALIDDRFTEFLLAAAAPAHGGPGERADGVSQLRFRHSVWTGTEDCWLEDLFVDERARRHGLGRALVLASCGRARERGAARIELDTNEHNSGAIALYESLGFDAMKPGNAGAQGGRELFMGLRLS
jgi:GNAT superfamily N-acetyltransferase